LYNNTISLPTFHRLSEVQIKKISHEVNKKI
jgi:dTDP-4-amino-4,6-dideoxygalactose transaminase